MKKTKKISRKQLRLVFLTVLFIIVNVTLIIESPWYMLVHPIVIFILFVISRFRKIYAPYIIEISVGIPWAIVFVLYFSSVL